MDLEVLQQPGYTFISVQVVGQCYNRTAVQKSISRSELELEDLTDGWWSNSIRLQTNLIHVVDCTQHK